MVGSAEEIETETETYYFRTEAAAAAPNVGVLELPTGDVFISGENGDDQRCPGLPVRFI